MPWNGESVINNDTTQSTITHNIQHLIPNHLNIFHMSWNISYYTRNMSKKFSFFPLFIVIVGCQTVAVAWLMTRRFFDTSLIFLIRLPSSPLRLSLVQLSSWRVVVFFCLLFLSIVLVDLDSFTHSHRLIVDDTLDDGWWRFRSLFSECTLQAQGCEMWENQFLYKYPSCLSLKISRLRIYSLNVLTHSREIDDWMEVVGIPLMTSCRTW